MIIGSQLKLPDLGDVVEDAPEALDGGDGVYLLQTGLVLRHGGVVDRSVQPEGPRSLQRHTRLLLVVKAVDGGRRQLAGGEAADFGGLSLLSCHRRHAGRDGIGNGDGLAAAPAPVDVPAVFLVRVGAG